MIPGSRMTRNSLRYTEGRTHEAAVIEWMHFIMGDVWDETLEFEIDDDGDLLVTLNNSPRVQEKFGTDADADTFVWNLGASRPPHWVEGG